jgi:hypothetical protein
MIPWETEILYFLCNFIKHKGRQSEEQFPNHCTEITKRIRKVREIKILVRQKIGNEVEKE